MYVFAYLETSTRIESCTKRFQPCVIGKKCNRRGKWVQRPLTKRHSFYKIIWPRWTHTGSIKSSLIQPQPNTCLSNSFCHVSFATSTFLPSHMGQACAEGMFSLHPKRNNQIKCWQKNTTLPNTTENSFRSGESALIEAVTWSIFVVIGLLLAEYRCSCKTAYYGS